LSEVFDGDATLADYVQKLAGYSLTGQTGEQIVVMGHGTGGNGKGTFYNQLMAMAGDYGCVMPFSTIELHQRSAIPNDLAALDGARLVTASETQDGTRLNESRIKALSGCDPLTARFLHAEFFTFRPVAKFWLAVNHQPIVRDDSHGFWRRMRLLPSTQTFAVDPTLDPTLRAELPGILAWAVRGCLAWQVEGLATPAAVLDATARYEQDSDVLGGFIDEAIDLDPGAEVRAADLYQHYKHWADSHGLAERERFTAQGFGRKVAERFRRVKTKTGSVYLGLSRRTRVTDMDQ
jgi:putative DNA primase/helicase